MAFQDPRCSTPVPGEKLNSLVPDPAYYDFCIGFLSQETRDVPCFHMPGFGQESYRYDSYYALTYGEYTLSWERTEGRAVEVVVDGGNTRYVSSTNICSN